MAVDIEILKRDLVALSHDFYRRGWSLATSSNFSARIDPEQFLISASGKDKGSLASSDFISVDLQGRVQGSAEKASAETLLHAALYCLEERTACVLHTHSVYSTILSLRCAQKEELILDGYEMLKALAGIKTHEHREVIPVVNNSQNISHLSEKVVTVLKRYPDVHSFLIAGHGVYTWGESIFQAKNQLEALEFMLECEYRK